MTTFKSDLTGMEFDEAEKVSGTAIRKSLLRLIRRDYPDFGVDCFMSISELNVYLEKQISETLTSELGQLTELHKTVVQAMSTHTLINDENVLNDESPNDTIAQRVADKVADFGGSWTFIISFILMILFWVTFNIFYLSNKGFDPYPFILLNLILSCVAALQAPVIMMSQNRQEEKDRERAKKDYMVNLKSELEIRVLHEKVDHIVLHQHKEIVELLKEIRDQRNTSSIH
jgi:uncharacterized membrane protein